MKKYILGILYKNILIVMELSKMGFYALLTSYWCKIFVKTQWVTLYVITRGPQGGFFWDSEKSCFCPQNTAKTHFSNGIFVLWFIKRGGGKFPFLCQNSVKWLFWRSFCMLPKPDQNYRDNIAIHRGLLARPKKAGMDGFYSILFFVHRERPLDTGRRGYQK